MKRLALALLILAATAWGQTPVYGPPNVYTGNLTVTGGVAAGSLTLAGGPPVTSVMSTGAPAWLQYLGTGAEGPETCGGNLSGDHYYTTFTVSGTCTVSTGTGLTIHATGACSVTGTITASAISTSNILPPAVGTGGGGGGGTAAGADGVANYILPGLTSAASVIVSGGPHGAALGGNATNGNQPTLAQWTALLSAGTADGQYWAGGAGGVGGSTGGTAGKGGAPVILICASITGSGTINTSGGAGGNSTGNNVGPGGGGAAGPIILSSQAAETYGLTLTQTAGAAGSCLSYTGCGTAGNGVAGQLAEFSGW